MLTDELSKTIELIKQEISFIKSRVDSIKRPASETILDDIDLQQLLNVSKRKTAQWREKGSLPYYKPSGKIFYLLSDVLKMLDNAKIDSTDGAIRAFILNKKISKKRTKK